MCFDQCLKLRESRLREMSSGGAPVKDTWMSRNAHTRPTQRLKVVASWDDPAAMMKSLSLCGIGSELTAPAPLALPPPLREAPGPGADDEDSLLGAGLLLRPPPPPALAPALVTVVAALALTSEGGLLSTAPPAPTSSPYIAHRSADRYCRWGKGR